MTLIDLGDFKLRFDPKEIRISIDGEMIDIGARREEEEESKFLDVGDGTYLNMKSRRRFVKENQSNQKLLE